MFADAIAKNDLTQQIDESKITRIETDAKDEIGHLIRAVSYTLDAKSSIGHSLMKMVSNLNGIMGEIKGSANQLASAATDVSSSSSRIAAGAREQTDRVGQVSAAVEEMVVTIEESSRNAGEASSASETASSTASSGGQIVSDTIQGMDQINRVVQESAVSIGDLAKSAEQIDEIITVINDIADQTNLLALNAAIEAARAGEQGRGFAVVADEVRKLAERTGKATGEIGDMIKTIQVGTGGAVKSMEAGTEQVKSGQELANKAGESLSQIVNMSADVVRMIEMIASASEQQTVAANEIAKNVEGFRESINKTASETEGAESAVGELNQLADSLQEIVGKFSISEQA
ncbi:MAG: methyl-accepting chemotaxis protein [bacterium]|nr:methyl-accepting chemotaxis protein [bacterium]